MKLKICNMLPELVHVCLKPIQVQRSKRYFKNLKEIRSYNWLTLFEMYGLVKFILMLGFIITKFVHFLFLSNLN